MPLDREFIDRILQGNRPAVARGISMVENDHPNGLAILKLLFPHTGRITFADSSFNAQTGTFLIRASVDNPKGTLLPNQYVRVRGAQLSGASGKGERDFTAQSFE